MIHFTSVLHLICAVYSNSIFFSLWNHVSRNHLERLLWKRQGLRGVGLKSKRCHDNLFRVSQETWVAMGTASVRSELVTSAGRGVCHFNLLVTPQKLISHMPLGFLVVALDSAENEFLDVCRCWLGHTLTTSLESVSNTRKTLCKLQRVNSQIRTFGPFPFWFKVTASLKFLEERFKWKDWSKTKSMHGGLISHRSS